MGIFEEIGMREDRSIVGRGRLGKGVEYYKGLTKHKNALLCDPYARGEIKSG